MNPEKWQGPFVIVTKINDLLFVIKQNKSQTKLVHHDRLKPYPGNNDLPDWVYKVQEQALSNKNSSTRSRAVQTMM